MILYDGLSLGHWPENIYPSVIGLHDQSSYKLVLVRLGNAKLLDIFDHSSCAIVCQQMVHHPQRNVISLKNTVFQWNQHRTGPNMSEHLALEPLLPRTPRTNAETRHGGPCHQEVESVSRCHMQWENVSIDFSPARRLSNCRSLQNESGKVQSRKVSTCTAGAKLQGRHLNCSNPRQGGNDRRTVHLNAWLIISSYLSTWKMRNSIFLLGELLSKLAALFISFLIFLDDRISSRSPKVLDMCPGNMFTPTQLQPPLSKRRRVQRCWPPPRSVSIVLLQAHRTLP